MGAWSSMKGMAVGTFCGQGPVGFLGLGSRVRWIGSRRGSVLRL